MRKDRLVLSCIVSVTLASAAAAWAEPASSEATPTTPSLMDDALRIWNQAPATDAGEYTPQAPIALQRYRPTDDDAVSDNTTPRYLAPGGSSLTPNLDRLLQRSGQPLVRSDGFGSGTATWSSRPRGSTTSPMFSKGGNSSDNPPPKHDKPPDCPPPTPTPEPGSLLLFGAAAVSAAAARRRRARMPE